MSRLTLYKDNLTESTIVSNRFIDEYMKDANDAQLKVYLYLLRMMNSNLPTSISDIVDKFNHTENDVVRALTYWEKRDLLRLDYDEKGEICGLHMKAVSAPSKEAEIVPMPKIVPNPAPEKAATEPSRKAAPKQTPSVEKPSYSLDDVAAFKKDEGASQILFIAESYLGRTLSVTDIKSLLFIYKELKLSIDLIDYLIEYCVGKGKREMRYIEAVAVNWAAEGISTVRQAKNRSTRYEKLVYTIMKALGRTSEPTEQEAEYIHRWNKEYGFSQDVILLACEKTVIKTQNNRFNYAEAILSNWRSEGLRTVNDVKKSEEEFNKTKDSRSSGKQNAKPNNAFNNFSQQRSYDFEKLEKEIFGN